MTGVYFSTISTERTIASVAAGEAFAKIRLYDEPTDANAGFMPYEQAIKTKKVPLAEYLYPSTGQTSAGQYSWAAICRRARAGAGQTQTVSDNLIEFIVFVCRESNPASKYWVRKTGKGAQGFDPCDLPRPVRITITQDPMSLNKNEVTIVDPVAADRIDERAFVSNGTSIVDDATGQIYRVLERSATQPDRITLDRPWTGGTIATQRGGGVWVVPPPTSGGRDPLIAIYQRVLRFESYAAPGR
jgi:hypothetical protein